MKFQAPKGTRDFYPDQMAARRWIEQCWHDVSRRNGFVEYDGPIFEYLDLYRVKSGDEIVSQLFHFTDRGGRAFAIRPEMTPTLARMVAARANTLAKPIKWYAMPRLCRAERPQRGRLREFMQWNIDILGEDSEIADAECVFVAADFFRDVGLSPEQVEIRINSRALVTAVLHTLDIAESSWPGVLAVMDKRDKVADEKFTAMVDDLKLDANAASAIRSLGDARGDGGLAQVERLCADDPAGRSQVESLRRVLHLLTAMGVGPYCQFDMSVVRGLAYYTGMVFEAFGRGGLKRAVCGGGRYARLLSDLGGPPIGGVGFATSDVVVRDLIEEYSAIPQHSATTDCYVIDASPRVVEHVLTLVGRLRGMGIGAGFSYKRIGVGKQFKSASVAGARRVVIVEEDFPETGRLTVKDTATATQTVVSGESWLADPMGPLGERAD